MVGEISPVHSAARLIFAADCARLYYFQIDHSPAALPAADHGAGLALQNPRHVDFIRSIR